MDKSAFISKLREHAAELRAAGILHLDIHGSIARGEATPSSDVDLIAEFDRAKRLSLIGRAHLENLLTDILGVKADLADRAMLRPEVLERAQRESILVF
jgi:predicted nucleotidyltransferase